MMADERPRFFEQERLIDDVLQLPHVAGPMTTDK
jgi:hypothetical protein